MRTKRFLSLLLAAVMTGAAALTLSSCKSDENSENSEKPAPSKYDVTGTWMAEVEAPGTVGGGGQMTYDHLVTACKFNTDGTGTWYRFMLTNDSGNPIALDGGAGHGDFTYSVGEDGKIACRLTGSQAPAYYPASLALTLSNDTIAGREGDVAYKMSRASDIMARWITEWDRRLHGGGNSDETTGDIVDLSTLTGDLEARNGQTLTGALGCYVKVSIADGATVTLRDATINGRNKNAFRWAGITCPGNATLVLEGENSVRGFQRMFPGIHIAPGKTLTIKGSGTLSASSNGYGAGIGGGSAIDCGHIVIEGGTITSEGGNEAAGIGGGAYAACGNITITDDVTSLTATKGDGAKHSVGAGADGSCGTVTIFDKVGAISDDSFIFPIAATGVSLSQTEATLAVGETLTLTATMIPEYAANFGASNVTWSSSDEAVATVNESGVVTAKGPGEATITVTTADGGYTATCTVTVYTPVTGVSLSQTSAKLQFGETLTLTATVAPDNAANKNVTWSSSNQDVATVDENGVVTAKTEGTATITVTTADGKKTATCKVTVIDIGMLAGATTEDVGKIAGADGKIYATKADAEANGTTAVAVIAYVGTSTGDAGHNNGLAIALADEGEMNFNQAITACTNKNTTTAVKGGKWYLPSQEQWQTMFSANGGNNTNWYGLDKIITNAGGAGLPGNVTLWTSKLSDGKWSYSLACWDTGYARFSYISINSNRRVRACLAF